MGRELVRLLLVILQGSDFEMGYQYAQQVIQIFGPWLMRRKAGRTFTEADDLRRLMKAKACVGRQDVIRLRPAERSHRRRPDSKKRRASTHG